MNHYRKVIGIHGVPRSGTSWLAQIVNSCEDVRFKFQPLFSYEFKDRLDLSSTPEEISQFFNDIFNSDNYFLNLKDPVLHKNYPVFQKNKKTDVLVFKQVRYHHLLKTLLEKNDELELITIVRNPLGVLSSWKMAPKEFNRGWDFNTEWRSASLKNDNRPEEFYGFEKWKEATTLFIELASLYPGRVSLIKYSDLINDPIKIIDCVFNERGLTKSNQTTNFIEESKSRRDVDPNSCFSI